MKWLTAVVIAAVGLCGCKSSQTPFNTLAPFGASRVPPPSTTVGATGAYYNRTATPQTATPAPPNSAPAPATAPAAGSATGQKASSFNPGSSSASWQVTPKTASASSAAQTPSASSPASAVSPASYTAGTNSTTKAASATTPASGQLRLSGMPVNDATNSATGSEPAKFVPSGSAVEISQLPKPIGTPAPATITPATSGTVVASAQASEQAAPAPSSAASTLQWKSRP
jgi:hypothetical protein